MSNRIIPPGEMYLAEFDMYRSEIVALQDANEIIKRKWNAEFNRQVLQLVRNAIYHGVWKISYHPKVNFSVTDPISADIGNKLNVIVYEIEYKPWLGKSAYQDCREQAERIVRQMMEQPKLHRIPKGIS